MTARSTPTEASPFLHRRTLLAAGCAVAMTRAARAAAPPPVRIGQCLPLTGPLGPVVRPIAEGQKMKLDAVNARGGIHGAHVELLTRDDAADPARTLEHTRSLLDQGVASLFGYAFVPGLVRTLPLLEERRVPLLGVYNGADNLRKDRHAWLFTTTASLRDEVAAMVRNLATLNSRRIAVAYQNNELGRFMLPQVESVAAEHQVTLVAKAAVEPDGSNAVAAIGAISRAEPQAILLLAGGAAVTGFVKALPPAARVPVYALSLAGTTALMQQLGPLARGIAFTQVVPYPMRQVTPLTRQFGAAVAAARLEPTYDRMWGFLNATILVEVLQRAGPRPTPATVQAVLEKLTELDVGGYRVAYGNHQRNGSSFVEITMVDAGGKFIR